MGKFSVDLEDLAYKSFCLRVKKEFNFLPEAKDIKLKIISDFEVEITFVSSDRGKINAVLHFWGIKERQASICLINYQTAKSFKFHTLLTWSHYVDVNKEYQQMIDEST